MYNRLQIYDICNLLFLRRIYMTWSDLKEKNINEVVDCINNKLSKFESLKKLEMN